jgi:hypothetical protein
MFLDEVLEPVFDSLQAFQLHIEGNIHFSLAGQEGAFHLMRIFPNQGRKPGKQALVTAVTRRVADYQSSFAIDRLL